MHLRKQYSLPDQNKMAEGQAPRIPVQKYQKTSVLRCLGNALQFVEIGMEIAALAMTIYLLLHNQSHSRRGGEIKGHTKIVNFN